MNCGAHYAAPSSVCHFISDPNVLLRALFSSTVFVLSITQKTRFLTHATAYLVHGLKRKVKDVPSPTPCFFQCVPTYLHLHVKGLSRYVNLLPPSISEFRNMWNSNFSPHAFITSTRTNLIFYKMCKIVFVGKNIRENHRF